MKFEDYAAVFFITKTNLDTRQRDLDQRYNIDLFRLSCRELLKMENVGTVVMCVSKPEAERS